jgi:hypothetical protein
LLAAEDVVWPRRERSGDPAEQGDVEVAARQDRSEEHRHRRIDRDDLDSSHAKLIPGELDGSLATRDAAHGRRAE